MKGFLIKWFINTVTLLAVIHMMPGISVDRLETAFIAALVLGLLNTFLRPIAILFTLPFNILTLGFFTLIINGFLFYLVSRMVAGFSVIGFWNAFWGALLFSVISFLLNIFISPQGQVRVQTYRYNGPRRQVGGPGGKVIDVKAEEVEDTDGNDSK